MRVLSPCHSALIHFRPKAFAIIEEAHPNFHSTSSSDGGSGDGVGRGECGAGVGGGGVGMLWGSFFSCKAAEAAGGGGGKGEGEGGVASYLGASAHKYALGCVADMLDLV